VPPTGPLTLRSLSVPIHCSERVANKPQINPSSCKIISCRLIDNSLKYLVCILAEALTTLAENYASVPIVRGGGLVDRGDIQICIFCIASRLNRDPPNLLRLWVRGEACPREGGGVDHLRVMPILRVRGAMRRLPLRLRGVMLD
jgi:hypothetical protein